VRPLLTVDVLLTFCGMAVKIMGKVEFMDVRRP